MARVRQKRHLIGDNGSADAVETARNGIRRVAQMQQVLEDGEGAIVPEPVAEIEEAMIVQIEAQDALILARADLKNAQQTLAAVMDEHKREEYRMPYGRLVKVASYRAKKRAPTIKTEEVQEPSGEWLEPAGAIANEE